MCENPGGEDEATDEAAKEPTTDDNTCEVECNKDKLTSKLQRVKVNIDSVFF